jgi:hypothetical protein
MGANRPVRVRLSEAVSFGRADPGRFDPAAGILRDVPVLGRTSRNRRTYTEAAIDDAIRLAEGASVYLDHAPEGAAGRGIRDRFGRLHGLYKKDGKAYAKELRYNPAHQFAESFKWHVHNDPDAIGLSIDADGDCERTRTGLSVKRLNRLYSVDLVDSPATCNLKEQYERADMGETLTDPADPVTVPTVEGHKDHLIDAVEALLKDLKNGTLELADVKAKVNALLKMIDGTDTDGDGIEGSEDPDDDDDETPDDVPDEKLAEALLRSADPLAKRAGQKLREQAIKDRTAARIARAAKVLRPDHITEQFRDDLAHARDEAHADRMIADRAKLVGGPRSAGRTPYREKPVDEADEVKTIAAALAAAD